jgi:hypothetical protein
MCRNLILLGKNEHRQVIFTCEHGTIHITHYMTTLCMTRHEFMHFAEVLLVKGLHVLNQSRRWQVRESDGEYLELWVNSGGLRLEAGEFFALCDLIRQVWQRLQRDEEAPILPEPRHSLIGQRWSLN